MFHFDKHVARGLKLVHQRDHSGPLEVSESKKTAIESLIFQIYT